MKDVLTLIEKRKQEFAQLPFFEYLRNEDNHPRERLSFAPYFAFFIMSFADLNKYILRETSEYDDIQKLVNQHTYEEDSHWMWYLKDLGKLGYDKTLKFSESLEFLWNCETATLRQIVYQMLQIVSGASPIQKIVIIETFEATANVFEEATYQVCQQLQVVTNTNTKYEYFGDTHYVADSSHAIHSDDILLRLESIKMDDEEQKQAFLIVEKLFYLFTQLMNNLLLFATSKTRDNKAQLVEV